MILGIDIGGSFTDILLMNEEKFHHYSTLQTSLENINEEIEKVMHEKEIEAVGIGIAAWLRKGKIVHAPNLPFKSFNLQINLPCIMENDANCFAYAASKILGESNMIGITVGTGIGMGIVIDGKIYRGEGIAGEIGHNVIGGNAKCVCGGKGHLECYFSGWSIRERYGKEAKELFAEGKFPYDENFEIFCRAIANAVMLFDLPVVAIGGRIGGRLEKEKLNKIYDFLPRQFKPEIKIIKDDFMVAKGACFLAKEILK